MSKKELVSFRRDIVQGTNRSPLFWWLVEQHDELTTEHASRQQNWASHCKRMARQGVVDAKGKTPTCEAARKAWQVVRKEVAAGRVKRPQDTVSHAPSRQRPDWQPPIADAPRTAPALPYRRGEAEEVLPPRRPPPLPPSQAPPVKADPLTIDDLSPRAREMIERVKRELAEDDRKKFGHF